MNKYKIRTLWIYKCRNEAQKRPDKAAIINAVEMIIPPVESRIRVLRAVVSMSLRATYVAITLTKATRVVPTKGSEREKERKKKGETVSVCVCQKDRGTGIERKRDRDRENEIEKE